MENVMLQADWRVRCIQNGFCTSSSSSDGKQQTLSLLSQLHRPAGGLQLVRGQPIHQHHTGAIIQIIQLNSSYFSSRHNASSCSAPETHECAPEPRESPQPNTTGKKRRPSCAHLLGVGTRRRSSNNTPRGQPCADRPPNHIQQEVPCTQKATNIPSPLFSAQGVLVITFHESGGQHEVILFQQGN